MPDVLALPVYESADTHLSIVDQATVLNWFISQIVNSDPLVRIDLVGFSLGGIIAAYWAATTPVFFSRGHINSITLVESPVGGIPLANAVIDGCNPSGCDTASAFWKGLLDDWFGPVIVRQLQLQIPGVHDSIVGALSQAAANYPITAVQSTNDYLVNDKQFPVLGLGSFLVGRGAQEWLTPVRLLFDQPLGGALADGPEDPGLASAHILFNHGQPLAAEFTLQTILDAVQTTRGVAVPAPPVRLSAPSPGATLRAWGGNVWGELGDESVTTHTTPITPELPLPVVAVAAGFSSLAVLVDGSVWSWGFADGGVLGRNASQLCIQNPGGTQPCDLVPRQVTGLSHIVAVASGLLDSYALDENGTLWAWGQTAPGATFNHELWPIPRHIMQNVVSVATGYDGAIAVRSDGTLWAWGRNTSGEAANGTRDPLDVPTQVRGSNGVGFLTNVVAATTGRGYAVALVDDGATRTVWAWGDTIVDSGWYPGDAARFPVRVPDIQRAVDISTGLDDTLILLPDRTVEAFGSFALGDGGNFGFRGPGPVKGPDGVGVLDDVQTVASGQGFNSVLRRDGTLWVWGFDYLGQLGTGAPLLAQPYPVKVPDLTNIQVVSAGQEHVLAAGGYTPTTMGIAVRPGETASTQLLDGAGTLQFPQDVVPPYLGSAVAITYTPTQAPPHPLGNLRFAGRSFSLDAFDRSGAPIHQFNSRYTITVHYDDTDWRNAGLSGPDQLNLYVWDDDTAAWQPVLPCDGCVVDVGNQVLIAQLDHMTDFAVLGQQSAAPPEVTVTGAPTTPIDFGTRVVLKAAVINGVAPYTYAWTRAGEPIAADTVLDDTPNLGLTEYTLTVTDAAGALSNTARVSIEAVVGGPVDDSGPASPGPTPELDSLILFATGLAAAAGSLRLRGWHRLR